MGVWVYEGDLIWSRGVVLLGWKGWLGGVWDLFVRLEWFWGSVVGGFWGTLWDDFIVCVCCVCWDEVDNALRKGRGLPKNVNRGDVYKYKNS